MSVLKYILSGYSVVIHVSTTVYKAKVTVVDIDRGAEEKIIATSQGLATGLNLKENQKIYFGGLPTIGNYRYTSSSDMYSLEQRPLQIRFKCNFPSYSYLMTFFCNFL